LKEPNLGWVELERSGTTYRV